MEALEEGHPPDNVGGWLGTSRRRVERICRANGVRMRAVRGAEEVKASIRGGRPVIVMLGRWKPAWWKVRVPSGHWMVAYGYDAESVYLTNRGRMAWADFLKDWTHVVPRVIGMTNRGLVADG